MAFDAAGNEEWTGGGVLTPPDSLTTTTVYTLLRPTCVSCHANGPNGFFENEGAFVHGIVDLPKWVTPGQGLESGLVKMLTEQNDGVFSAMPPESSYGFGRCECCSAVRRGYCGVD